MAAADAGDHDGAPGNAFFFIGSASSRGAVRSSDIVGECGILEQSAGTSCPQ